MISMLVVVTGLVFVYKKQQAELYQKDMKINVLIDEIGEIKNQNQKIYQYLNEEKTSLHTTAMQMAGIKAEMDINNEATTKQAALKKELEVASGNLLQLIQKKDLTIQSLQKKVAKNSPKGKMPGFTNILILGENMQLTDTIMLASINTNTKKITLISIPRDLFYNGRKINEYYEKFGIVELEKVIGEITTINPDKYVVVNMKAFTDIIDTMGGIDIDVKKAIVDEQYPGPNFTYTKVSFKKGYQHMDGTRALKYARSRKSTTDFDRSERQQEIITAVKQKAEEMNLKEDIVKLSSIYNDVKDKVKTDVSLFDALNYYNEYRTYAFQTGNVLSNQNFLYTATSATGQYILLPEKDSYIALQNYIRLLIEA